MINRRSFLLGSASLAALAYPSLGAADVGAAGPERLDGAHARSPDAPPAASVDDRAAPAPETSVGVPLPERVVAGYWTHWGSPVRLTDIPTAYNTVFLFHATPVGGAPGATGAVEWNPPGDARGAATHFRADLAEFRRTRTAILTVGGARAHVDLSTRARAQAFLDSVKVIHDELGGFDGLDWNTYEGQQQPNTEQMIWVSQQLKSTYGERFAITSPPAPWRPADVEHCRAMIDAGVLDMVSPQYYDDPGLATGSNIIASVDEWVERMGDASRVGLGLSLTARAGSSTLADVEGAWRAVSARHPRLRGTYHWDVSGDEELGWQFATDIAPMVLVRQPAAVPPAIPLLAPIVAKTLHASSTAMASQLGRTVPVVPRLPDRVVGTYWSPGDGLRLDAVHPDYNVIWVSLAEPLDDEASLDPFGHDSPGMTTLRAGMADLRQRDSPPRLILTGIPGPGSGTALDSATGADEFAAAVSRSVRDYGFDGFAWDLEHTPTCTAAVLERASRAIVTQTREADPAFALTVALPPAPREESEHTGRDRVHAQFIHRCRDIIDLVQWPCVVPHGRADTADEIRRDVRRLRAVGLRQDQIGILWENMPTLPVTDGSHGMPVDQLLRPRDQLPGSWGELRGAATRSAARDQADGWRFVTQAAPRGDRHAGRS